jgi:hypothetical protein
VRQHDDLRLGGASGAFLDLLSRIGLQGRLYNVLITHIVLTAAPALPWQLAFAIL